MNPNFSLKYGEKVFSSKNERYIQQENKRIYELEPGVTVTMCINEYSQYDAVEWVLWFENSTDKNSDVLADICDCDTFVALDMPENPLPGRMPKEGNICVITMNGMVEGWFYHESDKISATEFCFNHEYLDKAPEKTKKFCNVGRRSSEGMMPFFDVTANGEGVIAAIGWTGGWKAAFTGKDDGVVIKTGLKKAAFYLKPGEKLRTTSILLMKYKKDEEKNNKFRRLIKNHFSHKACTASDRSGLMAFELWGGLPSEEMKKRLNELEKYDIKFEDVWIDAAWYGDCKNCISAYEGDWGAHTGDWRVNKRIHPQEMKDVAEVANDAGMKLMLWFEPERTINDTKIHKEHPEWFYDATEWNNRILNYGMPEVVDYVKNVVSEYVQKLGLSCYRQDFNTKLSYYFNNCDEENRIGITEIRHICGMYEIWDYLLEKHPGLIIDNCSSGGRRIDIETLKRSIPFFRSDYQCNFNENPNVLQVHNTNISSYLPFNGCTTKQKNDTYDVRSSYSSSWGGAFYNAIFQDMSETDFAWAKEVTDEYRRIRKYFSEDFYNHGSSDFDDTSWAIWQYHDEKSNSGVVLAFRRENSPFESAEITLKGITDGTEYAAQTTTEGAVQIDGKNMKITLPKKYSSMIIEYKSK